MTFSLRPILTLVGMAAIRNVGTVAAMMKQVHQRTSQHDEKRKKPEQMCSVLRKEKETCHRDEANPSQIHPRTRPLSTFRFVLMFIARVHRHSRERLSPEDLFVRRLRNAPPHYAPPRAPFADPNDNSLTSPRGKIMLRFSTRRHLIHVNDDEHLLSLARATELRPARPRRTGRHEFPASAAANS